MADFDVNARPLDTKEDSKFVKFVKKCVKSRWFDWLSTAFVIAIYALPVALMVYVLIYFFNR